MMIPQPGDKVVKSGNTEMQLKWIPQFAPQMSKQFWQAQCFIDTECIRRMRPYTPMMNGVMMKSATLGTVIGSGRIIYASPYARYQYYGKLMVSSITGSPFALQGEKKVLTNTDLQYSTFRHTLAGPFWFERMKAEHKDKILAGAAKIAGGTEK